MPKASRIGIRDSRNLGLQNGKYHRYKKHFRLWCEKVVSQMQGLTVFVGRSVLSATSTVQKKVKAGFHMSHFIVIHCISSEFWIYDRRNPTSYDSRFSYNLTITTVDIREVAMKRDEMR